MGWFQRKRKQAGNVLTGAQRSRSPRLPDRPSPQDPGVPPMPLLRLGSAGRVDVVGESNYQEAISAVVGGREVYADDPTSMCTTVLIPEPNNPHDGNAVRVAVNGRTVGYLARENAAKYQPLLLKMQEDGNLGWCPARIAGGGDRYYGVFLRLAEPESLVPMNDPADLVVLEPDRSVVVTQRQHHQDVLQTVLGDRSMGLAYGSLTFSTVASGKHQGKPCLEVRINGERIGELSAKLSARYLTLVAQTEGPGCEVVLREEEKGIHAAALMPRPDDASQGRIDPGNRRQL